MSEGQIRVGIGGWTFPPWRGTFYPNKWPQSKELDYASRALTVIEINSTFYSRQSPKSWEKWAATAPDGFQFAIKGSRFCVTRPKLADAGEGIDTFFAQEMTALGPKLGPIMWQLAPRRKFDRDDIARFIDLLPLKYDGQKLRHAIEPRDESYRDERFVELCRARNVAIVFDDSEKFPAIDTDSADFTYARLQRMSEDVATGYEADALDTIADRARQQQDAGRDVYLLLINGAKVRAPMAALALQERLALSPRK
ncbi:DUF72 domain-containing protein [Sphingomonas sp.]|uniref:DUF72 domain-containing protein n=1 Tax=Sphingomonas sp. TaxID=28214 RepID=UPI0025F228A3|nr:DUF72 domain-containing protein [Sphingomonas sp.]MBV9527246.1 DUF72 domain-containing protein [Sphingomonas sp.]